MNAATTHPHHGHSCAPFTLVFFALTAHQNLIYWPCPLTVPSIHFDSLTPHRTLTMSTSAPAPVAVAVSASDLAAQDSGRIPPPDRSLERCHELGQASLRCQMNMQIKYNHKTQTPAVLEACRSATWTRRWSSRYPDASGRGCCSRSFLFAALASLVYLLVAAPILGHRLRSIVCVISDSRRSDDSLRKIVTARCPLSGRLSQAHSALQRFGPSRATPFSLFHCSPTVSSKLHHCSKRILFLKINSGSVCCVSK